jgi:hypothetical protein
MVKTQVLPGTVTSASGTQRGLVFGRRDRRYCAGTLGSFPGSACSGPHRFCLEEGGYWNRGAFRPTSECAMVLRN